MARIAMSPERYQVFLDAYLTLGPRHTAVARRVGCAPETAKRLWDVGWKEAPYAAPIHRVYQQALTRLANKNAIVGAEKAQTTQSDVDYAERERKNDTPRQEMPFEAPRPLTPAQLLQESSINAIQSEVDLLQAFRSNLVGAVLVSNRLLVGLEAVANAAAENLVIQAQNTLQVSPEKVLGPMEKFARILSSLTNSTKQVFEMQRLLVGAPQQITEQRGPVDSASINERMEKVTRVINLMRQNGLLPRAEGDSIQNAQSHFEEAGPNTASHDAPIDAMVQEIISSEPGPIIGQKSLEDAPKYAEEQQDTKVS